MSIFVRGWQLSCDDCSLFDLWLASPRLRRKVKSSSHWFHFKTSQFLGCAASYLNRWQVCSYVQCCESLKMQKFYPLLVQWFLPKHLSPEAAQTWNIEDLVFNWFYIHWENSMQMISWKLELIIWIPIKVLLWSNKNVKIPKKVKKLEQNIVVLHSRYDTSDKVLWEPNDGKPFTIFSYLMQVLPL